MNFEKLNGIWQGHYTYGNGYPSSIQGAAEPFSLDIRFDGLNFIGTCRDIYTDTYFDSPATIEGMFKPNLIRFIKRYPSLLIMNDNLETVVIKDEPSVDIVYTGFYYKGLLSRKMRFEGNWIITEYYLDENGEKQSYQSTGKWVLTK